MIRSLCLTALIVAAFGGCPPETSLPATTDESLSGGEETVGQAEQTPASDSPQVAPGETDTSEGNESNEGEAGVADASAEDSNTDVEEEAPDVNEPVDLNCGCPNDRILAYKLCVDCGEEQNFCGRACSIDALCYDAVLVDLFPKYFFVACADATLLELPSEQIPTVSSAYPSRDEDSDNDGFSDAEEWFAERTPTDPFDPEDRPDAPKDFDGDGYTDFAEFATEKTRADGPNPNQTKIPFVPRDFRNPLESFPDLNPATGVAQDGLGVPPCFRLSKACARLYVLEQALELQLRTVQDKNFELGFSRFGCNWQNYCQQQASCFDVVGTCVADLQLANDLQARLADVRSDISQSQCCQDAPPGSTPDNADFPLPLTSISQADFVVSIPFSRSTEKTIQLSRIMANAGEPCLYAGAPGTLCSDDQELLDQLLEIYLATMKSSFDRLVDDCRAEVRPELGDLATSGRLSVGFSSQSARAFWPDEQIDRFMVERLRNVVNTDPGGVPNTLQVALLVKGTIYDTMARLARANPPAPVAGGFQPIQADPDTLEVLADAWWDYAASWGGDVSDYPDKFPKDNSGLVGRSFYLGGGPLCLD